ncbi:longitudinals lacking protein, isoforms H/M/V-like isoform X17 [Melanaphis sacchari]|uniref:longitudinals lacking protein, isoforms H/M/V-like isoform X16 n=1 Tax=Melanaphis sacchari TaxID=742174 RepID=UPI000DC14217|nr:longitudinals lacking protein, isoforms H/M/V-like isoform X16 [Melanaphis sacchari]XP_025197608.1 longitudinals lacking protein, isoforms H/M/V-like isoform X17 [Melanaphis sacchari]
MAGDNQHFCLRWNNHQSTLISVFDTLLESGTLVDCTLAAEGQYLKAHKVVLSACSPYLELLLSQHYEKHPIVILKDVKFQELKSMMDYMYRGEVNISQDQLSTFLKAAESLQIKGLTDGGGNEDNTASSAPVKAPVATQVRKPIQQSITRGPSTVAQGLTIERRPESPHIRSRDDSASPTRKRRRNQRRPSTSDDPDSHIDTSNSCDVPPLQSGALSGVGVPNIPATITKGAPLDDGDHETDNSRINNHDASAAEGVAGPKIEPTGELIEPKTEYLEEINNEDSIEDLTLDDDDDMDNSMDMSRAGPSHDNSNQSFNQWPMSGNQTTDEVFMNAQEAVGAHRDTQDIPKVIYKCPNAGCNRSYKTKPGIYTHLKDECGVEPKFRCLHCLKAFKRKWSFQSHILHVHRSLTAFNKNIVCNEEKPVMFGSCEDSKNI